ncbi:formyltetrahydrofolate deformylase [Pseudomonas sichuanensis]|uniref:formyltetrahydrofolate deformylase n=1 Tax=Pseudomonas sichuanensis TaxID=2213015 RepID=UPI00215E10BE|nr:formyltetrahydrofolate deformylase [Pseudomonas sichuanensis]UVK83098.1 formyltetrahydrofolate deformylase [Pseudomonas sichuanensis]
MAASTFPDNKQKFILNASCTAKSGIVAAVTTFLAENSCYICSLEQFDDESTQRFFMRAVFYVENPSYTVEALRAGFTGVAESLDMSWKIHDPLLPVRTVIMVSRFDHCLDDLLYRRRKGDLNMEITAVVSNHSDLRAMAEREGIRFVHLPVTKENKAQQEDRLLEIVLETNSELVILARYMQILSNELSAKLSGSCINIHHSFLPGFKGAMPYHQAFERGVKQIGATAHYVTSDLDEGPIIEQVVTRVDHSFKADELARVGRDNECMALAGAVKSHIERRVFVDGNKTIVFHGS